MLYIVNRLRDLNFRQLMDVYEEGNLENAALFFPDEPENQWPLLAEQAFYQYLQECFFAADDAIYAIWIENDRYVSAARLEPYQDGLLLEALETIPNQRGKGYATALLLAILNEFSHKKIYSHVGKKNFASLRTHEKCGFYRILEYAVYADGSVTNSSCTFCSQK